LKKTILTVLLFIIMVFAIGCGGKTGSSTEQSTGTVSEPIKIGFIQSTTGPLEMLAKWTTQGFDVGMEYATDGKNEVANRPIQIIKEDDQGKPEIAIEKATKLLSEDKVDILIGTSSSAATLAILPLVEENKTPIIVVPAKADAITGSQWNKYVFRTMVNNSQDAASAASSIPKKNAKVVIYAEDDAYGRDGAETFKREVEKRGHTVVLEEYVSPTVTDHTAHIQKVANSGADYIYLLWARQNTPWLQMNDMKLFEKVKQIMAFPGIMGLKILGEQAVGMEGYVTYFHQIPNNEINKWFVEKYQEKYNGEIPDMYVEPGFSTAMAVVEALKQTNGDTDSDVLLKAMEGMSFETPKGTMTFRSEDHQALQTIWVAKLVKKDGVDYPIPEVVRELSPEDTAPPVQNK